FRSTLLDTTNAVEQAYDDLIYSRQYVDVLKEALFLARDQARITQIRIDVGASAPLDILQPRVQIATAEQQLMAAGADVRIGQDAPRRARPAADASDRGADAAEHPGRRPRHRAGHRHRGKVDRRHQDRPRSSRAQPRR